MKIRVYGTIVSLYSKQLIHYTSVSATQLKSDIQKMIEVSCVKTLGTRRADSDVTVFETEAVSGQVEHLHPEA